MRLWSYNAVDLRRCTIEIGFLLSQQNVKYQTAGLSSLNLNTAEQLTMRVILFALLCSLAGLASAQFQFFEQMFNQGGQQQQQQQQQQAQNVASDSEWYQRNHESGIFESPD